MECEDFFTEIATEGEVVRGAAIYLVLMIELINMLGGTSKSTYLKGRTRLSSGLQDMRMERKNNLIIPYDFIQRPLHVLANACQDYSLSLGIEVSQVGSFGGVDIDFPGKELVGLWKVRRD